MSRTDPQVISLDCVSRIFATDEVETHALSEVSFAIREGEFVAVMGPSGSGKSTLLAILGLLDMPSSGTYRLRGESVGLLSQDDRAALRNREIGFVFQSYNLVGDLTVQENVELPLRYRAGIRAEARRKAAAEALAAVDMTHRASHRPAQLSGGQQQRVSIARALVGSPAIILADEPTGNLDSKAGESVMDLLASLNSRGVTICVVTHDDRYGGRASRQVEIRDGRLVQ